MALSFYPELVEAIPENYQGVEVCEVIDLWLKDHPEAAQECRTILKNWLISTRKKNASDIDFGGPGCSERIWFRVYGTKKIIEDLGSFSFLESSAIILSWLTPAQVHTLFKERSVDFSLAFKVEEGSARFRGSCYFDNGHLGVNFRRINDKLYTMEGLGIPQAISQRLNLRYEKQGLVLVTGITGSGKSTTLDAVIDMNNRDNAAHIVIIGHPIEYVHKSKQSLVRHREVGPDVQSFEAGAVEALRQDPDIIVVGEMRDARTIATVLEITDSGHKAFTTLHTSSAIDSIHRIVAEFPPEEQDRIRNRLADVLSVCMSQKLVPTIDGKLVLAKEILSVDPSVQAAIRNKNIGEIYQMMVEGKRTGMCTLEQDLKDLLRKGIITQQNAMNYANNKKRMQQLLSMG
ncbi:MAG: ATPase, T2SS/T4P/T4SS family [Candidatus Cloacimonetes bacterium]|jgi:twitching motility protein PilT|nr:Flp pilus assembly complex ATPase component TadA [Candidatus Cloacimonadota bacterium]MDY0337111.1 ATPase, T2SS/T4P/T4SS family [Candidatus Cloacimonadaceae bacterium]MCK9335119.1 Flp pilus assembly complex ATPase component TadA [Candidatus Cloacimonadota bacterium]MDD2543690.1 ATPase, T2SS/T4P/T4SS family [Candidatus Cloacimonadota bacterium]MDD3096896.1 ATPase, T2SS/T4P/T4SS family [Candidatus Cloacimonadota bacterium]